MTSIRTETETVIKRVLPYLRRRGYEPETDIDFETAVKSTKRYSLGYVDLLITSGKAKPQFLIEAKRSSKKLNQKDRDQALDYGRDLKVLFVVVTNGSDIRSYNMKTSDPIRWDGQLSAKIPSKEQLPLVLRTLRADPLATDIALSSDSSLPFRPGLPLKQLNRLFSRCHNAIRKIEKDEEYAFADLSKILFLKLLEEKDDGLGTFQVPYSYRFHELAERPDAEADQVKDAILVMLAQVRAADYGDVLVEGIRLKRPKAFQYIVRQLASVSFTDSGLDTKGAAFEYFVRATLKGKRLGQYFTPRPLVELMVTLAGRHAVLDGLIAGSDIRVTDPACGTGGFLVYSMKDLLAELDRRLQARELPKATRDAIAEQLMQRTFFGSDANEGVAAAAKMNMIIAGDGHTNIRSEDTLKASSKVWSWAEPNADYILTNPPFGTSESDSLTVSDLARYPVATTKGQNLFLQRMVLSTKPGGIICTVIDEGLLNTETARELRRWLVSNADLLAVVRLPEETFQPNKINVRSSVLLLKRLETEDPDLERSSVMTFVNLASLGYVGSGEAIRGFDFERLRSQFGEKVLDSSAGSSRSGYHWSAFDISLEEWSEDPAFRLDLKYWDPAVRSELELIRSSGTSVGEINQITTRRGRSPSVELYVDQADGYAVVVKAGSCITKYGELDISGADYVEKAVYDEMPDHAVLQPGDVLVASTGDGTLGKACVFDLNDLPGVADGHVTVIRTDPDVYDPYYLTDYLRVGPGQVQIHRLYSGSTGLIELTPDHVDEIVIVAPPNVSDQQATSEKLRAAEAEYKAAALKAANDLASARDAFSWL